MQDLSSDPSIAPPLAPAGRPSRLKRVHQRLCNKASTLNPWRKVFLASFCTLLFTLFATLQLAVWLSRAGGTVLTCSCNDCVMSCTDKLSDVFMQNISAVGGVCRHARDYSLLMFHVLICHLRLHRKTWMLSLHHQW